MIAQPTPTSLTGLVGVGPKTVPKLRRLKINHPVDLLYHLPLKYLDFTTLTSVSQILPKQTVCLKGQLVRLFVTPKTLRATFKDSSGTIPLVWFNQPYLRYQLKTNTPLLLRGQASFYNSTLQLVNPQILPPTSPSIVPVYPQTKGLTTGWSRRLISQNFEVLINQVQDFLPPQLLSQFSLVSTNLAFRLAHFPQSLNEAKQAQDRLALNEYLSLLAQNHLLTLRQKSLKPTATFTPQASVTKKFNHLIASLPYSPTASQLKSLTEIIADLNSPYVTNRLLTGDVGSGKSLVIFLSALYVLLHGHSVFIIAPTQILATQHFTNFSSLFPQTPLGLVTAATSRPPSSQPTIYIGTQALLKSSPVTPALVVFDEQHRFGVRQRSFFSTTSSSPHLLTVSATPIPRTLQLTYFNHLSVSTLNRRPTQLPPKTVLLPSSSQDKFYSWLVPRLSPTSQAFVVCPHINQTDESNPVDTAQIEYDNLTKLYPHLPIGLIHSQLKTSDINATIDRFRKGELWLLVATPIIEVGVDIPASNIMLIKSAHLFGLSALHQLRGRVGRGSQPGFCFLSAPPTANLSRLKYFCSQTDGLKIAEYDLRLRGPGQFLSVAQHGFLPSLINLDSRPHLGPLAADIFRHLTSNTSLVKRLAAHPTVSYTILS